MDKQDASTEQVVALPTPPQCQPHSPHPYFPPTLLRASCSVCLLSIHHPPKKLQQQVKVKEAKALSHKAPLHWSSLGLSGCQLLLREAEKYQSSLLPSAGWSLIKGTCWHT